MSALNGLSNTSDYAFGSALCAMNAFGGLGKTSDYAFGVRAVRDGYLWRIG